MPRKRCTFERGENTKRDFDGKTRHKETFLRFKHTGENQWKMDFKDGNGALTRFIWLRIWTRDRLLWKR
jgi:hypothetical protein